MTQKMDFNISTIHKRIKKDNIIDLDLEKARSSKNISEFDQNFTFKIFRDVNKIDYYNTLSCETFLSNVQSPTLFINSKKDPISK